MNHRTEVPAKPATSPETCEKWPGREAGAPAPPDARLPVQGTVLLVEDEPDVRAFVQRVLEQAGYAVLEAPHPEGALQVVERHPGAIDLILSDVVMPGMSGRLMAERLAVRHPAARLLFMSGYLDDVLARQKTAANDVGFLQKPFTPAVLLERVRAILDRR